MLDQTLGLAVVNGEVGVDPNGHDFLASPSWSPLQTQDGADVVGVGEQVDRFDPLPTPIGLG